MRMRAHVIVVHLLPLKPAHDKRAMASGRDACWPTILYGFMKCVHTETPQIVFLGATGPSTGRQGKGLRDRRHSDSSAVDL
jgi:hypothetical protein